MFNFWKNLQIEARFLPKQVIFYKKMGLVLDDGYEYEILNTSIRLLRKIYDSNIDNSKDFDAKWIMNNFDEGKNELEIIALMVNELDNHINDQIKKQNKMKDEFKEACDRLEG